MAERTVQCKQCLATASVPDGVDPHTMTWCQCCTIEHHHGQAAESCSGNNGVGHEGAPCTFPNPRACTVVTPPGEDCPGGHCGVGVDGCTVCRPIIHFVTAGEMRLVI